MATQTSHNPAAASMSLGDALARIAVLEAQNRLLHRRLQEAQRQASEMRPGFYIIDAAGQWNGPCPDDEEIEDVLHEYPDGCTVVEVYSQHPARDEEEWEAPGFTVAGGYAFRQSLEQAANW